PLAQRRKVTTLDPLLEIGHVLEHLLPDLHGHHRAEEIRGEVPDEAGRPVRDLEHAVRVVGHLDAEVLVHLLRPHLRKVAKVDATVHDVLLDLEAKDHMHAVRDLVRADPDERWLHAVDGRVEAVELDVAELIRQSLLHARIEEDRKSTRLNSSHVKISYAVFCLKN